MNILRTHYSLFPKISLGGVAICLASFFAIMIVALSGQLVRTPVGLTTKAFDHSQQVKVMTYNIKDTEYNNYNHRQKAQKIAQYVVENKVEIVGLQEVANGTNSHMPDVVSMLAEELTQRNYSMEYRQVKIGTHGNAIFSTFPIKDYQVVDMTILSERKAQQITVQIAGKDIVFINTHLNAQGPCLTKLLGYISTLPTNEVVFMGDINEVLNYDYSCDTSNQNIDKVSDFVLSCRGADSSQQCIRTIVGNNTKIIDYIAVKKKSTIEMLSFAVADKIPVSDHFAVVATLKVNRGTSQGVRGDFDSDGTVTLVDFTQFLSALHQISAKFSLTGSDYFIDLFDYNELLKLISGSVPSPTASPTPTPSPSSAPTSGKSTMLACDLTKPQPNQAKMLNVGTWNVGGHTSDGYNDFRAKVVGEKFKHFDLDILIVQEVYKHRTTPFSDPVTKSDFPKIVQSTMPGTPLYFYSAIQDHTHSVITISKYPITESAQKGIPGSRAVTYALVDSPAGKVKIFNTHLQRQEIQTCPGLAKITQFVASKVATTDTYIIGGDLNLEFKNNLFFQVDPGGPYQCKAESGPFLAYFSPTCGGTPCKYGGTIDYIFGNGGVVYQYCAQSTFDLSDAHMMFVGTITVK